MYVELSSFILVYIRYVENLGRQQGPITSPIFLGQVMATLCSTDAPLMIISFEYFK